MGKWVKGAHEKGPSYQNLHSIPKVLSKISSFFLVVPKHSDVDRLMNSTDEFSSTKSVFSLHNRLTFSITGNLVTNCIPNNTPISLSILSIIFVYPSQCHSQRDNFKLCRRCIRHTRLPSLVHNFISILSYFGPLHPGDVSHLSCDHKHFCNCYRSLSRAPRM